MSEHNFDLVVIGSGPGGYVAAIRGAQLGLKTAIVEKSDTLGGTCLNVGCIPSKALLESTELYDELKRLARHGIKVSGAEVDLPTLLKRKDDVVRQNTNGVALLMKKNEISHFVGKGRLNSPTQVVVEGKDTVTLNTKRVLLATGSVPSSLPGVELDGERVVTSDQAISFPEVPKHLVLIGAGVIGLELGSVWARLGAKVTVLEYHDRIMPGVDLEVSKAAQRIFQKQGLEFRQNVRVTGAVAKGDQAVVTYSDAKDQEHTLEGDRVLVAVGRRPYTEGLGLEALKVAIDERGRVEVNERFESSVPGIYAIGDVIRGAMLAHKASEEGVAAVEMMVTGHGHVNYDAIPSIVYTNPEIASVGKSEEELKAAGIEYKKGSYPFAANGRAKAMNQTEGFVKILSDAKTDRLLGAHIIGPRAGDLIAELVIGMEFYTSAEDIGRSVHAHPTLAEVIKEAALAVDGNAIHGF